VAHAYTPGLRVAAHTVVRKTRRLPLAGDVLVQAGQPVSPDTVVAETRLPGNVHNVNVANVLGIAPEDVPGCMLRKAQEPVGKDEVIAQSRGIFGLFKSMVRSPVAGVIELVSGVTGQVLIREPPVPVQVNAYIEGRVVEVLPDEGVTIETAGVFIQGIFGIGGEVHAPLLMLAGDPAAVITEQDIDARCAGRIVCGGALATLDALRKLRQVGGAGMVAGGVQYHDVGELLGYQIGVAVTGGEDIGLTIIATEGFGRMRMADRTFHLLREHDGHPASMSGATQIRAGVIRPEVIIPATGGQPADRAFEAATQGLTVGSPVRVIRNPYFGQLGVVAGLPEQPRQLPTEATVRVLDVRLASGETVTVPRANVEMVES
jgi:hypothetical protein